MLHDVICSNGSERKVKDLAIGEVNSYELYLERSDGGLSLIEMEICYRNTLVPLTIVYNINGERLKLLSETQGFIACACNVNHCDHADMTSFDIDISYNENVSSMMENFVSWFNSFISDRSVFPVFLRNDTKDFSTSFLSFLLSVIVAGTL